VRQPWPSVGDAGGRRAGVAVADAGGQGAGVTVGLVAQPWPDRENLSEDEVAREQQEQGGLMWLLNNARPGEGLGPEGFDDGDDDSGGGVREPRRPDDTPPPLVQHAPEPDGA
jgi:hypothetical protein